MNWDLTEGNAGSGRLIVKNSSNVQIFSTTTDISIPTSGTFTTNTSQLPLTIVGSWVSGSSNIVRYRICNGASELFYSGDIDNITGSVEYLLSPTPSTFHVYLSSGASVYPSNC